MVNNAQTTPTRDQAVLLPCPFCGSAGKMIECMPMWEPGGYPPNGRRIVCSAAGCYGVGKPFYGEGREANAIASWNHRAPASGGVDAVAVPREPTEAMLDAYWQQTGESREMRARTHAYMRRYWAAMLEAAPASLPPAATPGLAMPSREWMREKIAADPDVEDCGAVPAATPT